MANKLHDDVFEFMEEYRATHSNFYYWLRERNNKNRLEDGFWFQGKESYAFVGLYDRGGGSNMTRSIGLVFFRNGNGNIKCQLEVVYNEEQDQRILNFYKNLMGLLKGFGQEHKTKYTKLLSENEGFKAAKKFLDEEKPKVDALIKETGLNELFIDETDFNEKFKRVISYKTDYPNYWLFQGNPSDYDISTALKNNLLQDWSVAAHKDKIRPNDRVIIWMGGKNAGCYALAIVISKPGIIKDSPDAHLYKEYDPNDLKVKINVTHNLIEAPLLWSEIKNTPELESLNQGYRGTNFSVTKNQFQTILRLITELSNNTKDKYMQPSKIKPLNQILYGPPGTGKTYHTVNKAVAIANPTFSFENKSRNDIRDEYERLKKEGQIEFITFHQSMTYEDFIEGIKPIKTAEGDALKYGIEDGIFKRFSALARYKPTSQAKKFALTTEEIDKASFYKISLGNYAVADDEQIYKYCIDNNYIALGWGGANNFEGKSEREIQQMVPTKLEKYEAQAVNYFTHYLKSGDFVVVSYGLQYFRAIGKVIGGYEFKNVENLEVHQFRKVQWLLKDVKIPVEELYNKQFSQSSIYKLSKSDIKKEFFVKGGINNKQETELARNHVLIIDEINRGNISAIFGELITLIEEDKRQGKKEALEVLLPYSKERFSVPSNLFIVGTMNTADRSVEALDTALRRRFVFEEMMPEPNLLTPQRMFWNLWWNYSDLDWTDEPYATKQKELWELLGITEDFDPSEKIWKKMKAEGKNENQISYFDSIDFSGGIQLHKLLMTINMRLTALLTKDHTIGHAWLMDVYSFEELQTAFKNKILPLLQEYFYNNFEKIGLVLGNSFIEQRLTKGIFAKDFNGSNDLKSDYDDHIIYSLKNPFVLQLDDFKKIYA